MKSTNTNIPQEQATLAFKNANISKVEGLTELLSSFTKRVSISYSSDSTIQTYRRAVRDVSLFHACLPQGLETDQIIDYLHYLKEKDLSWAKIKLDAAGLKYFYREIVRDEVLASSIPYPKEEKSLPLVLSRQELLILFASAQCPKHRVILRLIYGSGLRRRELVNLRIRDIETDDGKCRVRINKSKGSKDRYTVLSRKLLPELREYFKACRPQEYLFNGQKKGQPMSLSLLGYIMKKALERSGIGKDASPHILRHCFASHALEDGMNIRSLQQLLGHASIQSTMLYLHVSDVPLQGTFSPLDRIGAVSCKSQMSPYSTF